MKKYKVGDTVRFMNNSTLCAGTIQEIIKMDDCDYLYQVVSIDDPWFIRFVDGDTLDILNEPRRNFEVKEIRFNGTATIIFWADGTKTVVKKTEDEEVNDREKAIAMCFMKRAIGSKSMKRIIDMGGSSKEINEHNVGFFEDLENNLFS